MINILTLDDEVSLTEIISEFIEMEFENNSNVTILNDSTQAISKLSNIKYDLIITDHHMPENSGMDVLRSIRKSDNLNHETPVLFLTAMNTEVKKELSDNFTNVHVLNKVESLHLIGSKIKELFPKLD